MAGKRVSNSRGKNRKGSSGRRKADDREEPGPFQEEATNELFWNPWFLTVSLVTAVVAVSIGNRQWLKEILESFNVSSSIDPLAAELWRSMCSSSASFCHSLVQPTRHALVASSPIGSGDTLLKVPRSFQIWNLDALRDEFIQSELFGIEVAGFDSVVLAVYLALIKSNNIAAQNQHWRNYINNLPSYEELSTHHPLLMRDIQDSLGTYTRTFQLVETMRNLIDREYASITSKSKKIARFLSKQEYIVARIWVLTRGFRVGPIQIPDDHAERGKHDASSAPILAAEARFYQSRAGIDVSTNLVAIIPFVDFQNHHVLPNAEYQFHGSSNADMLVEVAATTDLATGQDVLLSFGTIGDPLFFTKYGFVSGDGSQPTECTLAPWYNSADKDSRFLQIALSYLRYDDGYKDCITQDSPPDAWEFKLLKRRRLLALSKKAKSWTFAISSRNATFDRPRSLRELPDEATWLKFDLNAVEYDMGQRVFETFRMISLTHEDLSPTAMNDFRVNVDNPGWRIPESNQALEYRTMERLRREARRVLAGFSMSVVNAEAKLSQLTLTAYRSRNWTLSNLRLGEMHALKVLQGVSNQGMAAEEDFEGDVSYRMRGDHEHCSVEMLASY